jgi:glycosyltransferase involved in cell wall biosynthesis
MIYLDATGACKSPKNTGMQRITRNIFRHLTERVAVTPISWNLVGNRYQLLGRRERKIMERPFQVLSRSTARPEIHGEHFFAELHRQFFRRGLRLEYELTPSDVLLIPDIYRDGRLRELPRLLKRTSARTVAIFHDAAALSLSKLYPKTQSQFRAYIDSLAGFDLVMCVSNASRDELLELWSESETPPTETVVETWPIELEAAREKADSAAHFKNLIVCIGSFEPRKNHLTLLGGAENLWAAGVRFELELIGRSTAAFGSKIVSELRRLEQAGRPVHWSKHVNDDALERAYRECRFTVYPSLMEGFGLPIAESLCYGKPVVCGRNGALGEIARDGGCLMVDQTDANALAAGMQKLLTDESTYRQLCAEAGSRTFRSWPDYVEKLLVHLQPETAPGPVGVSQVR